MTYRLLLGNLKIFRVSSLFVTFSAFLVPVHRFHLLIFVTVATNLFSIEQGGRKKSRQYRPAVLSLARARSDVSGWPRVFSVLVYLVQS